MTRVFRRGAILLPMLSAGLFGALLLHGSAVEAQTLEKPEVAQVVRLHLGANLFWHESTGADGYEIQTRSQTGGTWGSWSSISYTGTTQPAMVTGLTAGTKYQWRIRATRGSEQSEWSVHDDVNDLAYNWTAESFGRNIANPAVLQSAEPGDPGEVTVTWTHGPARSGVTITSWTVGYRLFSEPVNQIRQTSLLAASATMATVTGLTGGEQYEFWVRPYVGGVPGRTSNALEATPTTTSTPMATPIPTQSSDATLRALSVSAGSISPAFSSTTYAYTVSVAAGVASTTVTPTVNHSDATVTVNGTTVTSGSPSGSIPLIVGANTITVRVTAENGGTQDYTVTITRQSSNADLRALVASAATSESATYSPQTLTPTFASGTTSYAATVGNAMTHAKVTPTVSYSAATVTVNGRMVASGTDSAAIALNVGANAITVRVTSEDMSSTQDYTVTITRQTRTAAEGAPAAPSGLTVTPGPHSLSAFWTAPGGTVDGYHVHYTTVDADDLTDDAEVGYYQHPRVGRIVNRHPGRGWVTLPNTHKEPKYGMGYLQPGQEYRVRVRAYNSGGAGPWAVGKGTPLEARRTVSLSASAERVREGDAVTITATVKYNGRPSPIQEDMDVMLSLHLGTAESRDVGTVERISIRKYTSRGSVTIQTYRDGDRDDERFAVLIRSIPKRSLARAGHPSIVWVTITEGNPAPAEPEVQGLELQASGGDGSLHLSWEEQWSENDGYDVQYRRSATESTAATNWVDAGHTGKERSLTITGLTNRVSYDARVRQTFPNGTGGWSNVATATPYATGQSPTDTTNAPPEQESGALPSSVTLALGQTTVSESAGTVTVTATLDAPAPADGNGVSLGLYPGNESTATRNSDYTMPDSLVIPAGQRSGTASIAITNDAVDEADETVNVGVFADTGYATLAADATLTITDDDTAGVTVTAASPLAVDEGATATYTVVLDSQPTSDVTITASSGDVGAVSVSPASYTFTSSTWSTAHTFTVRGVSDADTNDESTGVSHSVTSTDATYANAPVSTVRVSVSDTTTPPPQQQNRAPTVASAIGDITGMSVGDNRDIALSGVFSDPDGDSLTYAVESSDQDVAWAYELQGTLTVLAVAGGTATITVTAEDPDGERVSDQFSVTVSAPQQQNRAPTVASAIGDATIVNQSGTQTVSLSGVFSDADNYSLTITAASSNTAVATVSVAAGGSSLTVSAQSRGTATVTVTADDGNGGRVSDAFSVRVKAAPTVVSSIGDVSGLTEGDTRDVSLSGVFTDADGDALTITAASSNDSVASVRESQGTLTVTAVSAGSATIMVTARDSDGNRVSDQFSVTVEAPAPPPPQPPPPPPQPPEETPTTQEPSDGSPTVAAPLADMSVVGPMPREVSLAGVFNDPDGDSLIITAVSSHHHIASMWVDGSTLKVVGISTGTATITVTARDADGNEVSDEFQVTVAPVS